MMENLCRFASLLKKELLLLIKNPKTRIALFLPPIMQMFVFGYVANMDLTDVKFSVLDYSDSVSSRKLIECFTKNGIFIMKKPLKSYDELRSEIDRRKLLAVLVIPERFEREMAAGSAAEVQFIVDGRNSSTAGTAILYAQSIVSLFNEKYKYENNITAAPIQLRTRAWYNPNFSTQYFMIPALLAMLALLDIMNIASLSVAREREEGTIDQLLVAPFKTWEILLAKAGSCMMVGMCQLTIGLLIARLWFQIPFLSSYFLLYFVFFMFLISSISAGLLVSVLSYSFQQAIMGTFLLAMPFVLLSGLTTPVENMPEFFQYLTMVNPMRYGIEALHKIFLEGAVFMDVIHPLLMMVAVAVGAGGLALFIFGKQRQM